MKAFAAFCGKSFANIAESYQTPRRHVLHYPAIECTAADKAIVSRWDFDVYNFDATEDIIQCLYAMFLEFNLIEEFRVPLVKFNAFLHELARSYNTVPYHNFLHACDVTQFVFVMIKSSAVLRSVLTKLDIFAVMIASLCHDIDHGGLNNAFQVNAQTPLAMLFTNMSIMETYHASRAIAILTSEHYDILCGLKPDQRHYAWNLIISSILATDMAVHFSVVSEFDSLVKSKAAFDTVPQRRLLAKLLVKCGDVSNVCRPFQLAKKWAEILLKEFFRQGDLERLTGLSVSPFMDRKNVIMAQMQLGFLKSIAFPMFDAVTYFASDLRQFTTEALKVNASRWAQVLADVRTDKTEEQHRMEHGEK